MPLPTKMDRYKLDNHFWHLDETVKHFSGTETRLYFYWVNRFNKGLNGQFWPTEYPRWSKQVEADLGITDKPLAAARKALEQRGLLYYKEGTKSKAPIWSLRPIVRNDSGQSENISRSKSDESEDISRNNSGQSEHITPDMSRNNSGQPDGLPPASAGETPDSIRRRHKPLLEQEDTNQKNEGAGVSFYDEGSSLAEHKSVTAPNPVAPAPSPTVPLPCFEDFWHAFGKKEDKYKCQQRWGALKPDEQCAAIAAVSAYVSATPEKRYRKNPLTWLNGKCWLDEDTPTPVGTLHVGSAPPPASAGGSPSKSKKDW